MNKLINKIIPNSFLQRKGLQDVLFNINWLTFEKIFQMFFSLFVGVWVARYLGPENYGIMNYAFAFVILSPWYLSPFNISKAELFLEPICTPVDNNTILRFVII